jgi:FixJ family two-component response regulator
MATTCSAVIAIVDNEASVRKALLRLFRASGFDAREFASGSDFLKTLPFCRYDCLVLDLHMPDLSGFDVQEDSVFAKAHLPTVIITAHDEPGTRQRCMSAGASAYLSKPFDDKALLKAVEDAIAG